MPTEEKKLTLPVGHPEAGYVGPDLSFTDGVGTLPKEEQDARDEQAALHEEEVQAVADHEHEIATKEREAQLASTQQPEAETKATTKTKASDSSS
jgi:hypothetical protein